MIDYKKIFDCLPGNYLLMWADAPQYTMIGATKSHYRNINQTPETIEGKPIFEVFPDASGSMATVKNALDEVVHSKKEVRTPVLRYDIPINGSGKFETRYWSLEYAPVLDHTGEVVVIIQASTDVTSLVRMGLKVS